MQRFLKDTSGATVLEYALLVGVMGVAVLLLIHIIGEKLNNFFAAAEQGLQ
jgi:Flp pilus assembly pilin Flp